MLDSKDLESAFRRCLLRHVPQPKSKDGGAKISPDAQAARNALRIKGWSQAEAARQIGVSKIHLNYVLNARRESRRLLHAIHQLPANPTPA